MWTFFQGPVSFVRSSNQSALSDVLIRAFYCKNGQFFPFSSYDLKSDTLDLNSSKLKQAFFRTSKTWPFHFMINVSLIYVPVNVNLSILPSPSGGQAPFDRDRFEITLTRGNVPIAALSIFLVLAILGISACFVVAAFLVVYRKSK